MFKILVPFEEKEKVKNLGAKWNTENKEWSVPDDEYLYLFKRWLPTYQSPFLYIDVVPESAWYKNLRSELSEEEWNVIKTFIYKRAGYKCEICGGKGENHPVEAHERWHYDDNSQMQTLIGIDSLCPTCHLGSHFGLACKLGKERELQEHIQKINNWSIEEFDNHFDETKRIWQIRSQKKWRLNAVWIIDIFEFQLSGSTISKIMKSARQH